MTFAYGTLTPAEKGILAFRQEVWILDQSSRSQILLLWSKSKI
ncbi:hypothetical protein AVDCRST_MAG84-2776 [uncultured Microcoleus sp.]|uniref:Uncharacterized protein n=1 Tax=uncultured Microcoleus sp. TaxID=259945 RepID=A0A6J4M558_9CYAN|nr:hypothetical protein AVDCRST_MAG84-2776 [uncultured Microcoleus sp.]